MSSQTFPCNGRLTLSAVTSSTTVYNITFGGFGAVFYNALPVYLNESFDALGFNPKDNYIYAVQESTNSIVRLRANGTYEPIGSLVPFGALNAYAGDCSPEGLYLCHDSELDKILVFSVLNDFQLVDELDLFWDPTSDNSGPFTTRIDDFAIDPNNPNVAYTFQGNYDQDDFEPAASRGYLLQINLDFSDPNVGMVTPVAPIPAGVVLQLGSLFFTKEGQLFGLGPYTAGPFISNRLISINPFTGATSVQGLSPPQAAISDGCSCPYSLSFENVINPNSITCSSSELDFVLTINNRSNEELSGLTLTDTLLDGMIIQAVSGDFNGDIAGGTGIGANSLTINNLQVPPRTVVVITISAEVIDIPVGFFTNQAHLTNLPLLFGGVQHSDNILTTGFIGDPSDFYAGPQLIDNVSLEVIPPSDCLNANDAQVLVSSPILLPGESYRIKLLTPNWEESFYDVLIDADNTFLLDSLTPNEYQLAEVTPENSLCSFAWKEESIVIDPPNEQLQATASSNSPICEGSTLALNGSVFPAGAVSWRGPGAFLSFDINSQIDSATVARSGTFEMTATYGACEQILMIDVLVAPDIQASINGELRYCEREQLQLAAEGIGDTLAFQWFGPANLIDTGQQLMVQSMAPANAGLYEVIIDNGFCQDTSSTTIAVRPSPTIELPRLIETDFCEPVQLEPKITGDNDVTYSWTPTEGLSCDDCLTPELQVPFLSNYRLTVVNDSLCTDSAEVNILLSMEKLLYIPNVFSPNLDGLNDYFQLFPGCGVSSIKSMQIIDRWGAIVYAQSDINYQDAQAFWDGKVNGKMVVSGVYIWQVEVELVDGSTRRLVGDVSLLR